MAQNRVLVLRTGGYSIDGRPPHLPESGPFTFPGFDPSLPPPHGIDGFAWGQLNASQATSLVRHGPVWQVVAVPARAVVYDHGRVTGKCRFGRGEVVYSGDRDGAIALMAEHAPPGVGVPWAKLEGGDGETVRVGDWGSATAGDRGHAIAGDGGHAKSGQWGCAAAGVGGTIELATLVSGQWSDRTWKVGEDGVRANWLHESRGIANPAAIRPAEVF